MEEPNRKEAEKKLERFLKEKGVDISKLEKESKQAEEKLKKCGITLGREAGGERMYALFSEEVTG